MNTHTASTGSSALALLSKVLVVVTALLCLYLLPTHGGCMFGAPQSVGPRHAGRAPPSSPLLSSNGTLSEGVQRSGEVLLAAGRASCADYASIALAEVAAGGGVGGEDGAPHPLPRLSVVVGTFQRYATLHLILLALETQLLVSLEVIVVDAGSSPPALASLPWSARASSPSRPLAPLLDAYLYRPPDGKYHRVRSFNEGVALATSDAVVLLDDDVIPMSPYWAYAALSTLRAHPHASMVQLPLVILEMQADLGDAEVRRGEVEALKGAWPTAFGGGSTVNLVVRRGAWAALGGFHPKFDGTYGQEDIDFHTRAQAAGHVCAKGPPYGCALHVGVFYGNRGIPTAAAGGGG